MYKKQEGAQVCTDLTQTDCKLQQQLASEEYTFNMKVFVTMAILLGITAAIVSSRSVNERFLTEILEMIEENAQEVNPLICEEAREWAVKSKVSAYDLAQVSSLSSRMSLTVTNGPKTPLREIAKCASAEGLFKDRTFGKDFQSAYVAQELFERVHHLDQTSNLSKILVEIYKILQGFKVDPSEP